MADIKRVGLPAEVAAEIIAKAQTASAVMALSRNITIPGRGLAVPVITGDPEADWVGETNAKPVSNSEVSSKLLRPYKLAVIETFSNELIRDEAALYDALVARLPKALATKFDNTVVNGAAPGSDFDTLASCTAQAFTVGGTTDVYAALVAADKDIAAHGGLLNGFVIAPQGKSDLLGAVDKDGRPLFTQGATNGIGSMVLGSQMVLSKGAYKNDTPDVVGVAGDWTQAIVGTVNAVDISVSDQATLTVGSGASATTINLWQQNMVAVRAEIEIGFRADTSCFNLITE